jgi:hypothetical protein
MTRAQLSAVVLALTLAVAPGARADGEPGTAPTVGSGRGLVYGMGGAFLLGVTPLTNVEVEDQPALMGGWLGYGRFGVELPPGITIALVAGGGGMGSAVGPVPLFLRALADVRWTIDAGVVRPFVSVAGGFLLLKAGPNLRATLTLQGAVGLEVPIAPWVSLEALVGVEAIMPGDALREVMLFTMLPQVGATFSY